MRFRKLGKTNYSNRQWIQLFGLSLGPKRFNLGGWRDRTWPDDWTAVTADGSKSAQFEHTFLVTEDGYEILTMRAGEPRMVWDLAKKQR